MKHFLLLFCTVLFCTGLFAQETDIEAPVNKEFLKYQQRKLNNEAPQISTEGFLLNEIPLPVLPSFDDYLKKQKQRKAPQFSETYDLRFQGLLTPVKNQGSCGDCWVFATVGSIESYWLKNGYGVFDISEQNIRTCSGFVLDSIDGTCTGGNPKKSGAYLVRRDGPVLESQSPYNTSSTATCNSSFSPIAFIDNFILLPGDSTTLKQAILDYGALYTNMMYSSTYLNTSNNSYYYSGTSATNHAVLLVGWDDNKQTDGGIGAWIIKNSYGSTWGENGFFYVSYNDAKILSTNACFPSRNDYNASEKIYMYDELGWISNTGYNVEIGYGLSKFITSSSEKITKVGTYVNSAGAILDFEIYDTKNGNTLSTLLGTLTGQICDFPGYYSFTLPQPITLSAGNDFYVKVKYNTPGYLFPIPFEKLSAAYAEPTIETGVCWISSSGTSWSAWGNDVVGKERDLCIRAYTIPSSTLVPEINKIEGYKIYPNPSENGLVTIETSHSDISKIEILNLCGKKIREINPENFNGKINISTDDLANGFYFVRIFRSNESVTLKILVE